MYLRHRSRLGLENAAGAQKPFPTPERRPLEGEDRRIIDVNVLAIFLVQDHPGNAYVSPVLEEGLRGGYVPIIFAILPLRAYWVMTTRWRCEPSESSRAILHFLRSYETPRYFGLSKESVARSFTLARELRHDVFDCAYLSAAIQEKASGILTTDTDFRRLCDHINVAYINPIPREVLKRFASWKKK